MIPATRSRGRPPAFLSCLAARPIRVAGYHPLLTAEGVILIAIREPRGPTAIG
jgi:hypothetical protein